MYACMSRLGKQGDQDASGRFKRGGRERKTALRFAGLRDRARERERGKRKRIFLDLLPLHTVGGLG